LNLRQILVRKLHFVECPLLWGAERVPLAESGAGQP
jgi:hypothetical protein